MMNDATDYVHTHVINYEPTYLVLSDVVARFNGDQLPELADELAASVDEHREAMGLRDSDLDDVDYQDMVTFEASNA